MSLLNSEFNKTREVLAGPSTPSPASSARVVSWNIDRGERLDMVASELERVPADICLLQEVDLYTKRAGQRDVGSELANRLHLNLAYAIEFEELGQEQGKPAFIGQATLSLLPIRQSRVLRFELQSGFWKPRPWMPASIPLMQRRLGSRIALVTELDFNGRLLVVYNAHLESRSYGRIQAHQIEEILADCLRYPPDTAIILGGDLNTKYLPSFFLHKLEQQGFHSATGEKIERTHTIAMALDWIFARGPVKLGEGAVRRDFKGSDHYPVYGELVVR